MKRIIVSSQPLSPLPNNCIDQMYNKESELEGTAAYLMLDKSIKDFSYHTLLTELMYSCITY